MSTRSTISIKEGNKVRTVYCHWDGYLSGVGQTLLNHYDDKETINELIDLGSISSLKEDVRRKKGKFYTIGYGDNLKTAKESDVHDFENAFNNVTIAYHRDRGEDLEIHEMTTKKKFDSYPMDWAEYDYLFHVELNEWRVRINKNFVKLTQERINKGQ